MIISASRRTDIPSFYSEWFLNRIKEGYALVPNPFNPTMLSRVSLKRDVVDCIVFWTKNPAPIIPKLDELKEYPYYFQFTLNPYGKKIENHLPSVDKRIETFKRLSDKIGKEKVIWRYDPVFTNAEYTVQYHKEAFACIADKLGQHTERCMIGFIDHYQHIRSAMNKNQIPKLDTNDIRDMAASFKESIAPYNVQLDTCTVKVDLSDMGIPSGMCIDRDLVERITGYPINAKKDPNQRDVCRCIESIDIGTYETCLNGCIYCYANRNNQHVTANYKKHDKNSPKLLGQINPKDIINERKMFLLKDEHPRLFH